MAASIHLEPVGPHHAPEVQKLVTSHPDIVGFTRMPDPYPDDGAATWIAQAVPKCEAGEWFVFAMTRDDGQVTGLIGLIGKKEGSTEMGYWVGGPFMNQGHATEAVRQLLQFAFGELGLKRVFATPLERNLASRRVLEKNGLEVARTYPNTEEKWDPTDIFMEYAVTRDEWTEAPREISHSADAG
jgi:ribosomal-protein-alanine N-acetyltransferase